MSCRVSVLFYVRARALARALVPANNQPKKVPLDRVIEELSTKLQKDDDVPMSHPICNPMWMGYYIKTLHQQESSLFRIQQLYFDIAFSLADIADTRYAQTSM